MNMTQTQAKVKDLRVMVDSCIKYIETDLSTYINYDSPQGNRELAIVKTKLQEAKMWAGKILEVQGHLLPEEYRDEAKK